MTDYDLGRAHGSIEIDSDVDVDGVNRGISKIERMVDRMERSFKSAERALDKFERKAKALSRNAVMVSTAIGKMTRAAASFTTESAKMVSQITGMTKNFHDMKDGATAASQGILAAQQALRALSTLSGAVEFIGGKVLGLGKLLKELPEWSKGWLKMNAAMTALLGTSAFLGKQVTKMAVGFASADNRVRLLQRGMAATSPMAKRLMFGLVGLSTVAAGAGAYLKSFAFALGMAFPQLNKLANFFKAGGPLLQGIWKMSQGVGTAIIGITLLKSGLKSVMSVAPKAIMAIVGFGAAAGGLQVLGVVIMGLVNAVVTLSGSLMLLPGALFALGTMGAVALVGILGVSKAFKAAAKEGEEYEKALNALPPGMQNVARSAHEFRDEFKKMRETITDTMFDGFAEDIRVLGETYIPLLETGTETVARSLNNVKDALVGFYEAEGTQRDTAEMFEITSRATNNFASALRPVLSLLTNVAMVGAEAFVDLTDNIGLTTSRWEQFLITARHNGEMRGWIDDGIQGWRDLGSIIADTGRVIDKFFDTLGVNGDDALGRMATNLDKFVESMNRSADGGGLEKFADHIDHMADISLDMIIATVKTLGDVFEAAIPFLESFSTAFNAKFITVLEVAGTVLTAFFDVMANLGALSTFMGQALALAAALKILLFVLGPLVIAGKLMMGTFLAFRGLQGILLGAAASMEAFANKGKMMSSMAGRMSGQLLNLAAALSGPVVAGLMVAFVAFSLWATEASKQKALHKQIADDYKASAQAAKEFGAEVLKANGAINDAAMGKMAESISKIRDAWKGKGEDDEKWTDRVGALTTDVFKGNFSGRASSEDKNDEANKYDDTLKALDSLKMSDAELAQQLASSDETYANFKNRLYTLGDGGANAVKELEGLRVETQNAVKTAAAIGPANLEISNGIKAIADESSSASDRLNALKNVLVAMGLMEGSAQDAAFALAEQIKRIGDEASYTVDQTANMGTDMLHQFGPLAGHLNSVETNAQSLRPLLKELGEGFLASANQGNDAGEEYLKLLPVLHKMGEAYGFEAGEIEKLGEQFGLMPGVVETILAVKGKDVAIADIASIKEQLSTIPENVPTTIRVDTQEGIDALTRAGAIVSEWNPETKGARVLIPEGLGEDVKTRIQAIIEGSEPAKAPIEAKADDAQINAEKKRVEELMKNPTQIPFTYTGPDGQQVEATFGTTDRVKLKPEEAAAAPAPEIAPGVTAPPAEHKTKVTVEGAEAAETKINRIAQLLGVIKDKRINFMITGIDAALGALNSINIGLANVQDTRKNFMIDGIVQALGALNSINIGLANIPNMTMKHFMIEGTDPAIGAIQEVKRQLDSLNPTIDSLRANIAGFASAVTNAFAAATATISAFATTALAPLSGLAGQARNSGAALGQGFADGITSKEQAVQAAALRLAQAASRPLPRSPAEIGPFSGKGWTPHRGAALAEGFAEGIVAGTPEAAIASLNMAEAVSAAMDSIRAVFGIPETSFSANSGGNGTKKYYRDPEVTEADLVKVREERAREKAIQAEQDAASAAEDIPDAEKRVADAAESVANAEKRVNEAKTDKSRQNAEESLAKAKERQALAEQKLTDLQNTASTGVSGGGADSANVDGFIQSLDDAQYGMGAFNESMLDCSAFVSSVANVATGRDPFSERGNTTNMAEFLAARGFVEGQGGAGDLSVGWWDNGGGVNGHTALTTGSGLNAESTSGGVRFGEESAGARSNNSQFTNFMHLPGGGGLPGAALPTTDAGVAAAVGQTNETEEQALERLKSQDAKLAESLAIAQDANSTDAQVIAAMQNIDASMVSMKQSDQQLMNTQRQAIMEDRGLKEYDPFEGATEDPVGSAIQMAQDVVGLFDTIEQGIQNAQAMAHLLTRGLSSTKDVSTLVDGVQSIVGTFTSIVSTVGSIVNTVASFAALAGSAIPGIGQIGTVISALTGGIANVNAVVDLAQEVAHIGGRMFGGALSLLAGGSNGALQGNVKTLLDFNDNTIKTWSDRNSAEKTVRGMPFSNKEPQSPNAAPAIGEMNVYQGPGSDPAELMNNAMFTVKAHSTGVFAG